MTMVDEDSEVEEGEIIDDDYDAAMMGKETMINYPLNGFHYHSDIPYYSDNKSLHIPNPPSLFNDQKPLLNPSIKRPLLTDAPSFPPKYPRPQQPMLLGNNYHHTHHSLTNNLIVSSSDLPPLFKSHPMDRHNGIHHIKTSRQMELFQKTNILKTRKENRGLVLLPNPCNNHMIYNPHYGVTNPNNNLYNSSSNNLIDKTNMKIEKKMFDFDQLLDQQDRDYRFIDRDDRTKQRLTLVSENTSSFDISEPLSPSSSSQTSTEPESTTYHENYELTKVEEEIRKRLLLKRLENEQQQNLEDNSREFNEENEKNDHYESSGKEYDEENYHSKNVQIIESKMNETCKIVEDMWIDEVNSPKYLVHPKMNIEENSKVDNFPKFLPEEKTDYIEEVEEEPSLILEIIDELDEEEESLEFYRQQLIEEENKLENRIKKLLDDSHQLVESNKNQITFSNRQLERAKEIQLLYNLSASYFQEEIPEKKVIRPKIQNNNMKTLKENSIPESVRKKRENDRFLLKQTELKRKQKAKNILVEKVNQQQQQLNGLSDKKEKLLREFTSSKKTLFSFEKQLGEISKEIQKLQQQRLQLKNDRIEAKSQVIVARNEYKEIHKNYTNSIDNRRKLTSQLKLMKDEENKVELEMKKMLRQKRYEEFEEESKNKISRDLQIYCNKNFFLNISHHKFISKENLINFIDNRNQLKKNMNGDIYRNIYTNKVRYTKSNFSDYLREFDENKSSSFNWSTGNNLVRFLENKKTSRKLMRFSKNTKYVSLLSMFRSYRFVSEDKLYDNLLSKSLVSIPHPNVPICSKEFYFNRCTDNMCIAQHFKDYYHNSQENVLKEYAQYLHRRMTTDFEESHRTMEMNEEIISNNIWEGIKNLKSLYENELKITELNSRHLNHMCKTIVKKVRSVYNVNMNSFLFALFHRQYKLPKQRELMYEKQNSNFKSKFLFRKISTEQNHEWNNKLLTYSKKNQQTNLIITKQWRELADRLEKVQFSSIISTKTNECFLINNLWKIFMNNLFDDGMIIDRLNKNVQILFMFLILTANDSSMNDINNICSNYLFILQSNVSWKSMAIDDKNDIIYKLSRLIDDKDNDNQEIDHIENHLSELSSSDNDDDDDDDIDFTDTIPNVVISEKSSENENDENLKKIGNSNENNDNLKKIGNSNENNDNDLILTNEKVKENIALINLSIFDRILYENIEGFPEKYNIRIFQNLLKHLSEQNSISKSDYFHLYVLLTTFVKGNHIRKFSLDIMSMLSIYFQYWHPTNQNYSTNESKSFKDEISDTLNSLVDMVSLSTSDELYRKIISMIYCFHLLSGSDLTDIVFTLTENYGTILLYFNRYGVNEFDWDIQLFIFLLLHNLHSEHETLSRLNERIQEERKTFHQYYRHINNEILNNFGETICYRMEKNENYDLFLQLIRLFSSDIYEERSIFVKMIKMYDMSQEGKKMNQLAQMSIGKELLKHLGYWIEEENIYGLLNTLEKLLNFNINSISSKISDSYIVWMSIIYINLLQFLDERTIHQYSYTLSIAKQSSMIISYLEKEYLLFNYLSLVDNIIKKSTTKSTRTTTIQFLNHFITSFEYGEQHLQLMETSPLKELSCKYFYNLIFRFFSNYIHPSLRLSFFTTYLLPMIGPNSFGPVFRYFLDVLTTDEEVQFLQTFAQDHISTSNSNVQTTSTKLSDNYDSDNDDDLISSFENVEKKLKKHSEEKELESLVIFNDELLWIRYLKHLSNFTSLKQLLAIIVKILRQYPNYFELFRIYYYYCLDVDCEKEVSIS
ncbi:hypothetical protein SNEBB_009190 [Seison nebaliae]|nr:hypothetical protein SNEBB_009190 [Seison nebaliae]